LRKDKGGLVARATASAVGCNLMLAIVGLVEKWDESNKENKWINNAYGGKVEKTDSVVLGLNVYIENQ
jgi:hypothetical protein